jgi:hypothetical protein
LGEEGRGDERDQGEGKQAHGDLHGTGLGAGLALGRQEA